VKSNSEAKAAAEKANTSHLSEKFRPSLEKFILWIGTFSAGLAVVYNWPTYKLQEKQLPSVTHSERATRSEAPAASSKRVIQLAPAGRTERIPLPHMMRLVASGKDIHVHCVYADNREVSFVPGIGKPCPDGDMPFVYISNDRPKDPNIVTISFESP
jgi:hypothetical protein